MQPILAASPGGANGRPATAPLVQLVGVEKAYPGVQALKSVDFALEAGTVHALVGENGAGKSTLLKVLCGIVHPDAGRILIDGEEVHRLTPRTARLAGIRVVAQERQIAGDLSVAENVLLGRMPGPGPFVRWRDARRLARERLALVGMEDVDLDAPARELGVAQQQAVEIARALSSQARVVVLDEPTAALAAADVERLFANVRRLRDAGAAVVYVSHHLEEIFEIADVVTVMRDGSVVASAPVGELDERRLVELMLGREMAHLHPAAEDAAPAGEALVQVRDVVRAPGLHGISFDVCAGEILAFTGTTGSGRRELARCLAGLEEPDAGTIAIAGGEARGGPRGRVRSGVVFLPEDRKRSGLFLDLDLVDNIGVGRLSVGGGPAVRPRARRRDAWGMRDRLRIRTPSVSVPVRTLSGGNQQKVMLARWLATGARVFVFDEPTAGIDVGAKVEIYSLLRGLAEEGAAIVIFSSDLEEIRLLAQRVVVLRRGRAAAELRGDAVSKDRMLSLVMGAE